MREKVFSDSVTPLPERGLYRSYARARAAFRDIAQYQDDERAQAPQDTRNPSQGKMV